jgi:hypothetical protein
VTAVTLHDPNVIRIQPPLVVDRDLVDGFLEAFDETLTHVEDVSSAALHAIPDLVRFFLPRFPLAAFE